MHVELTQEHASRLEELMMGLECPKEFICYKSGFTQPLQSEEGWDSGVPGMPGA